MEEFYARQRNQIYFKIVDYRQGVLGLNGLVQQLEGLARSIDENFWADQMFPLVFDLERINSDLIDKRRQLTQEERDKVDAALEAIEKLVK